MADPVSSTQQARLESGWAVWLGGAVQWQPCCLVSPCVVGWSLSHPQLAADRFVLLTGSESYFYTTPNRTNEMGLFRLYTSSDHHVPQVSTSVRGVLLAYKLTTNIRLFCIVFHSACDVGLYCIVFDSACLSVVVLLVSVVMADRCWTVLPCFSQCLSEVKRSQVSAVIKQHPCVHHDRVLH